MTTAAPRKATNRPMIRCRVRRSPATRKSAQSAENIGLVAIKMEPMDPLVCSKPIFIKPICIEKKTPSRTNHHHSDRLGRMGIPRNPAHSATQTIAILKRRKAVHMGGNASRLNLMATAFPPHNECTATARTTVPKDNFDPGTVPADSSGFKGQGNVIRPPSATKVCPLTKLALSDRRNTMASAMSSGFPKRLTNASCRITSRES